MEASLPLRTLKKKKENLPHPSIFYLSISVLQFVETLISANPNLKDPPFFFNHPKLLLETLIETPFLPPQNSFGFLIQNSKTLFIAIVFVPYQYLSFFFLFDSFFLILENRRRHRKIRSFSTNPNFVCTNSSVFFLSFCSSDS